MDFKSGPSTSLVKCCDCGCICNSLMMNRSLSGTMIRSVKRKFHEVGEGERFSIPGFDVPQVAHVEISNEIDALREIIANQQETIQDLSLELEEERNASSSATNETMSMIIRLQREKAEIQMEARQFKRFAEEKMSHDQQELLVMEDLLYKKEEAIQALYCEVQAYKLRMMSFGLSEGEADGERRTITRNNSAVNADGEFDLEAYDYPPLKCYMYENSEQFEGEDDVSDDVEKYVFGETPRSRDHLKDLEFRINQLERGRRSMKPHSGVDSPRNMLEKVIVGHTPKHLRRISGGSANSFFTNEREMGTSYLTKSPKFSSTFGKKENFQLSHSKLRNVDTLSEAGENMSDRVYTIDYVHPENKPGIGVCDDYLSTPRDSLGQVDFGDPDVMKLYMRLQALEADRESMRQAIISMRTDKAQLVLLKEIAQHLYKDMTPAQRKLVKKRSIVARFSSMSVFKWIWSVVFWRKRSRRSKYMFGKSLHNAGLLMLLDKGPRVSKWRCLSRIQKIKSTV